MAFIKKSMKMKFENSKFDNDKGVKEGSAQDKRLDAKQKKAMKMKGKKK